MDEVYENLDMNSFIFNKNSTYQDMLLVWDYIIALGNLDLKSIALKTLLEYPRDMFDLIVFDIVGGQYLYPLVDYFGNPPLIGESPYGLPPYALETTGSHYYSYIPVNLLPYTDNMTFLQRTYNLILSWVDYYLKGQALSTMYEMAKRRFGENIVPFNEVEKQITILLSNYDPNFDFPQPLPPNIISVGGLHTKRRTKLPDVSFLIKK